MEQRSRTSLKQTSETKRKYIIDEALVPHQDLVIEILRRLPAKSLARFLLVSKLWSTIIKSQDFIRSFPFVSSIQPQPQRLLFGLNGFDKETEQYNWHFYSDDEKNKKTAFYSLSRTDCEIEIHDFFDAHYVNGLMISRGYDKQQIITNPSTGKYIILPALVESTRIIKSFFGYDPIDCEYKVLCISERFMNGYYWQAPSSFEYQVFTLERGESKVNQSWSMIECNIVHHYPKTNGLCINGVLYYGALTGTHMLEWCLMRFDVRTEKLDLFSRLNENVESLHGWPPCPTLINYQGKLTLAFETLRHIFDLWVMEDAEKWFKVRFSIHPWTYLFDDGHLRIIGTNHIGDIVFVPYDQSRRYRAAICPIFYYDHKRNSLRRRKVVLCLGDLTLESALMVPFFNYVENAMWL